MNPLTLVKRIQKLNSTEADLGISEDASWHAKYRDSAYVFVGGIPYDLTEGDLLAVFAQYGEIVDVNLVRDKATGKSKGFAFLAYEDQRSTILAVDNLNAAQVMGRTIRVDHVSKYKKKEEEDEETERQKREERGVCRAFQKGECTRGAGCKFSHDAQRAANTGWGHEEDRRSKQFHDSFGGGGKPEKRPFDIPSGRGREPGSTTRYKADESDAGRSRRRDDEIQRKNNEVSYKDRDGRGVDRSSRGVRESHAGEDYDQRDEKRSRHQDREDYHSKRSSQAKDSSSSHRHRDRDDDDRYRSRR